MVQAVQVTRWKTFDGKDFATRTEAERHEGENFHEVLGRASVDDFKAVAHEAHCGLVAEAVLRAASAIRRRRRAAGVVDEPNPVDP